MAESQTVNISHSVINSTIINVNQTVLPTSPTTKLTGNNMTIEISYIKMPEYTTNTLIIILDESSGTLSGSGKAATSSSENGM